MAFRQLWIRPSRCFVFHLNFGFRWICWNYGFRWICSKWPHFPENSERKTEIFPEVAIPNSYARLSNFSSLTTLFKLWVSSSERYKHYRDRIPKVHFCSPMCCQFSDFVTKTSYFEYSFSYQRFSLFYSVHRNLAAFCVCSSNKHA